METKCKIAENIDDVISLHKEIFKEDNHVFFENLRSKPYYKIFVATQQNIPVAYCIMSEIANQAELINIGTLASFRHQGIAKKLLNYVATSLDAQEIFLEVATRNTAAIALYKSCGFTQISQRKNYYGDDDAIIMKKQKTLKTKG